MTGSLRRAARVIVINVIVFGVLAETIALLAYFVETGGLFYIHRPVYESGADSSSEQLTADALNPYFGPSHRVGNTVRGPTRPP